MCDLRAENDALWGVIREIALSRTTASKTRNIALDALAAHRALAAPPSGTARGEDEQIRAAAYAITNEGWCTPFMRDVPRVREAAERIIRALLDSLRAPAPRPLAETPGAAEVRPTTSTAEWSCGVCGRVHRAGDPVCAPAGGLYEIVERARLHMERNGQAWPSAITPPLLAALGDMVAEAAARARRALAETPARARVNGYCAGCRSETMFVFDDRRGWCCEKCPAVLLARPLAETPEPADELEPCVCGKTRVEHEGPYGEGYCAESGCEAFEAAPASRSAAPCPGPRCPMCSGEACALCGPSLAADVALGKRAPCEHDVMDRHGDEPAPASRSGDPGATPCATCGGSGYVSTYDDIDVGISSLSGEPCPDCAPPPASGDARTPPGKETPDA
jgi:hypothetical protein